MPEVLDLGHLGEEAVATDVEAPAVALDRAADAADHVVGLEDDGVLPPFGQQVGRRQPPGARAGDDDGGIGGGHHDQGRLVDPQWAPGEAPGPRAGSGRVGPVTGPRR